MIRSQPQPITLIHDHIPYQKILRQTRDTRHCKEVINGVIPFILFRMMDIGPFRRYHPGIIVIIYEQLIGSLLRATMLRDMLISPYHLAFGAIYSHQITVAGSHHQQVIKFGKR